MATDCQRRGRETNEKPRYLKDSLLFSILGELADGGVMLLICPKKHALPTKISMIYFGELVSYLRCAQMSCSDLEPYPSSQTV